MKLICKLSRQWGTKVNVGGTIYEINVDDGSIDVPDEHAVLLLQNADKWADPEAEDVRPRAPLPRASAAVLVDPNTGRELSQAETEKAVEAAQEATGEPAEDTPAEEPPADDEPADDPEEAPDEWPEVSMTSHTKAEMQGVLDDLVEAGYEVEYSSSDNKSELLEKIQETYDTME